MGQSGASSHKTMRSFFVLWGGQAISLLGSQLVQFALIWHLTKQTNSGTVLATASLVGLLPQVILGPFVGVLVDRWNRRVTMFVADSIVALATLALMGLFWSGSVELWHIFLVLFIRALAGGFHWPAMQSSTSLMVAGEQLTRVQGLNQMLQGGLGVASAPLGALLLSIMPIHGVLLIDVLSALFAVVPLLFIAVPQPANAAGAVSGSPAPRPTFWADFRSGFRYLMNWPGLMMVAAMAVFINFLFTPAFTLLPLLVTGHFGGEAIQLGVMESAAGLGIIGGGLLLGTWGGFKRRIMTTIFGLVGMGIATLLLGLTPASLFWLAVVGMLLFGAMQSMTNGPILAIMQSVVAPEMQGRVFTLISSLAGAMSPLGLLIAGPVSDLLGVRFWFVMGGVITPTIAVALLFIPVIMNLEDSVPAAQTVSSTAADVIAAD